jgi:hypothetical protein
VQVSEKWLIKEKSMCIRPNWQNKPNDMMVSMLERFVVLDVEACEYMSNSCCLEMVEAMKRVAQSNVELTVEERNLLSVAYKNVIGARRASWRIISSIEQKEENKGNETHVTRIKEYRTKVETELANICYDILRVLDEHLIPTASTGESKVFYYKM